jgi:hypothetical protein
MDSERETQVGLVGAELCEGLAVDGRRIGNDLPARRRPSAREPDLELLRKLARSRVTECDRLRDGRSSSKSGSDRDGCSKSSHRTAPAR